MICEKSWEFNNTTYLAFVDLEKAFDRVPRSILWNILRGREYQVPRKLITAIESTYVDSICKVKTQTGNSDWFRITTGVKQGSVLSPILFITFMDYCGKMAQRRVNGEIFGYADDLALFADTEEILQDMIGAWNDILNAVGMKINTDKTEVMVMGKMQENLNVRVGGRALKQSDHFKYLGVCFGSENSASRELDVRRGKFNSSLISLFPLMKDRNVPRKVKTIIYTSILRPILVYGYESWALSTRDKSKIQSCEMRVLRVIMGVTRRDRRRNEDIREELGVENILKFIERGQLRWFGHVKRMDEDRYPRRFYEWRPMGRRGVGRPRIRWKDNIRMAIEGRGGDIEDVEEMRRYGDRRQWRDFVQNY
jgi:hypothetical protein